ncbi:Fic family protein [Nocardioides sp. zg-536]|uniref:Fic family protein n=1 Tax=Nocardioides faecalis TaxID=2803858 RepID=A0A938Y6Z1_9ACTN|nr:Fic family protein [Nocardioides faecalis]MBM9460415.1 Fic family protein [Nocardioides faecalis]QVI59761.1 Fic family protein [Nocardioides faecalis]
MSDVPPLRDWAPHTAEVRWWRQRTTRGPRVDRLVREVTVSRPPYIAEREYPMDRPLRAMTTASVGDLSHLDLVHGRTLKALNHLQLRTESVDSSKIENVDASLADYGRALLGSGANASATSMASATAALSRMIREADTTRKVSAEAMLRAHHDLFRTNPDEAHRAGRFRTTQNWVGGSDYSPRDALHVPPPPETVPDYLDDLFAFCNRDDLPPVVQAAIAHAQFESIHPFIDGNGRIGRTLIHAILRRRRSTRHLTVPIASALVTHRDSYFAALNDYRAGNASTIVAMMATAIRIATAESWTAATNLLATRERWGGALPEARPGSAVFRLLDLLTEQPILNVELVERSVGLGADEAEEAIETVAAAKILTRVRRTRKAPVWLATDVLHEVEELSTRIQDSARRLRD